MKHILYIMLLVAAMFSACRENSPAPDVPDRNLALSIGSRADDNVADGDNLFSNLYLFFFDGEGNNVRAYYRAMRSTASYTADFEVPENFEGSLAVVANYNSSSLDRQINLSMDRDELWGMVAHKSLGFRATQLPMIGEAQVGVQDSGVAVELVRMVARIDLYLFAEGIDAANVKVKSVTLRNQMMGTTVEAGKMPVNFPMMLPYPGAPAQLSAVKDAMAENDGSGDLILINPAVAPEPSAGEPVEYGDPAIRAYSFQYIPAELPQGIAAAQYAPQLDIVLDMNGVEVRRSCYVTREVPTGVATPQYGLLRNYIYRVHAVIRPADINVKTDVFDWLPGTDQEIEWDDVTTDSFSCTPVGGASQELTVKYGVDENSGRVTQSFNFRITAPQGRYWTASLSNSTDFELVDDASRGVVSSGIVGQAPGNDSDTFIIEVRALKEFTGSVADRPVTYLSIAMQDVDGMGYSTMIINPDKLYGSNHDAAFKIVQESN